MANRLRDQHMLDAAITAAELPRAPNRGGGLILNIPASRPKRIVKEDGGLTAEG
jgi:hypothetical protein